MTAILCADERVKVDTPTIVVADHQGPTRQALARALAAAFPTYGVDEAGDLKGLGGRLAHGAPIDLVLLDLAMPSVGGLSGLLYLRAKHPDVPVAVITGTRDRVAMERCIEAGAAGVLPKSADGETLRSAILAMLSGQAWLPQGKDGTSRVDDAGSDTMRRLGRLTPQQLRVQMLLSQGLLNKQIAYELGVSEATVKAHVSAILQKLGVESRTRAVIAVSAIDQGELTRSCPDA